MTLQPCFFWLTCGPPHYTLTAIATVASPAGIANVDIHGHYGLRYLEAIFNAAPYTLVTTTQSRFGSLSVTATDVDGNIGNFR